MAVTRGAARAVRRRSMPAAIARRAAARHAAGLPDARLERARHAAAGGRGGARVPASAASPVHCDAVQAAGKIRVDVAALGVDSLTIGAHKFHGPLGAAALWMRPERRARSAAARRRPGAASPRLDRERGGDRRLRRGGAARGRGARRAARAPVVAARSLRGRPARDRRRPRPLPGLAAAAQHLAPRLRRRRGRGAHHPARPRGLRGLDRLGLRVGHGRAEPDAARDGPVRRGGAVVAARQLRHDQHRWPRSTRSWRCWPRK